MKSYCLLANCATRSRSLWKYVYTLLCCVGAREKVIYSYVSHILELLTNSRPWSVSWLHLICVQTSIKSLFARCRPDIFWHWMYTLIHLVKIVIAYKTFIVFIYNSAQSYKRNSSTQWKTEKSMKSLCRRAKWSRVCVNIYRNKVQSYIGKFTWPPFVVQFLFCVY